MHIISNPSWLKKFKFPYAFYQEIPADLFDNINNRLDQLQSDTPLASIVIAAWNEETNILNCISSLASNKTSVPIEIIIVNNNSSDDTQLTINKLHTRNLFQAIQGCGPARQLAQENAKGEYILLADADCIYPEEWISEMIKELQKKDVVCVYGRYSFISEIGFPRWKLYLLEKLKDVIAEIRHFRRPYLNAYGISMGYVKEFGLKAGYIMHNTRGDDGRLCFDLMKYGQIKQVKSAKARPWTGPRTLQRDGNFNNALKLRIHLELTRIWSLFKVHPPHNTKLSKN